MRRGRGRRRRIAGGTSQGNNRANCNGCGSQWDGEQTAPVGSFGANAWGLYDMHGNVWEWVGDCWHENYRRAPSDGTAWTSGGDCSLRVLRGGSWSDSIRGSSVRPSAIWVTTGNRLKRSTGSVWPGRSPP